MVSLSNHEGEQPGKLEPSSFDKLRMRVLMVPENSILFPQALVLADDVASLVQG